jgi:hypothetical protein
MSNLITSYLTQPNGMASALMEKCTQTRGEWHPADSLWRMAWKREESQRPVLRDLAWKYLDVSAYREHELEQKQEPMPEKFKPLFGPADTKLGRRDENHTWIGTLVDIAVECGDKECAELAREIVEKYAMEKNSYLSRGGVQPFGAKSKYLGGTGRWRKFAMIARMLGYDVPRLLRSGMWGGDVLTGAHLVLSMFDWHLDRAIEFLPLPDDPKADHLPFSQYVCPFQMGLACAALRMAQTQPWPLSIKEKIAVVYMTARTWVERGFRRDAEGTIYGCVYDVKYPDFANTFTEPGNVDFVLDGKPMKAHDGMGTALHLAGIDYDFDKFLWPNKVAAKFDPLPILWKFGMKP